AASIFRAGLPCQMVEIHDPVRVLFIVETSPEAMLALIEADATISRLVKNAWVQVATLDPEKSAIHLYRNDRFEPYAPEVLELPSVPSSLEWYRGWRDHLGFASITPDAELPDPNVMRARP